MSLRIGVGIARDAVTAVVVRDGTIEWSGELPREPGAPLGAAVEPVLRQALEEAAPARWHRVSVRFAIGPHSAQVRLVGGLPATEDAALLAKIVRENQAAFFLENGVPLTTGAVRTAGAGTAWAAAFEVPEVTELRDACLGLGLRKGHVLPAAVALPASTVSERFTWSDGDVALEVRCGPSGLEELRKRPAPNADPPGPALEPVAALEALEDGAPRFAAAYGAAALDDEAWMKLGVPAAHAPGRAALKRRLALPGLPAAVAALMIAAAPLQSLWLASRAESELRSFHATEHWEAVGPVLTQLGEITAHLAEIEAFTSSRTETALLLAGLARSLPDRTVLTAFELDGERGGLVALAPRAADLLAAVRASPGIESAEPAGSPTARRAGGRALEVVRVRFRLSAPALADRSDP